VNGLHQKVDHCIDDPRLARHQIYGVKAKAPGRRMAAHLRCFFAIDPSDDLLDPDLAGGRQNILGSFSFWMKANRSVTARIFSSVA